MPHVIGWHDSHCASAALLAPDGRILYAAAEERFTKHKMQKGRPDAVLSGIDRRCGGPSPIRCYTDLPLAAKVGRNAGLVWNSFRRRLNCSKSAAALTGTYLKRAASGRWSGITGERSPADGVPNADPRTATVDSARSSVGRAPSGDDHARSSPGGHYDMLCDHHVAHAASAYFLSGFQRAHVVTLDGVGDCLSGTISEGVAGRLTRRRAFYYNELTVGADYETFTAMLGFNPDRHCGKITGLAAYGRHNDACTDALDTFFRQSWRRGRRNYFDRLHGPGAAAALAELRALRRTLFGRFTREDLARAMQHLAEQRVIGWLRENISEIAGRDIALAGGVFANVRINQKIKEMGFGNIFIAPPMDDGGLSVGAACHALSRLTDLSPRPVPHMFVGPGYGDDEIEDALDRAGVRFDRPRYQAAAVARLLADGKVVARFDGCMEFGPRALGNRSILYHTADPDVNAWLNQRLNRTEFMPFAPATVADHADRCYRGLDGCRHAAEFMTITFDCTDYMKSVSPAVVHVDGTARAQLVTADANPGLYEIIDEYRRITGIPSIVNTSFNMHEAPIVESPMDAIRTFQDGRLDYLAIGPFVAETRSKDRRRTLVPTGRHEEVAHA